MTKEIMLECLQEAKWVYTQYDIEQNAKRGKSGYSRTGIATIASALYAVRMEQQQNEPEMSLEQNNHMQEMKAKTMFDLFGKTKGTPKEARW